MKLLMTCYLSAQIPFVGSSAVARSCWRVWRWRAGVTGEGVDDDRPANAAAGRLANTDLAELHSFCSSSPIQ